MKWIMRIIGGIVAIIAVLVVISFFLPSKAEVSRSITIDAPPDRIFPYVSSLRRFNEWSPWASRDPNMTLTYSGPEEGVGQKMEWNSDHPEVGSGSQTIVESEPDRHVASELDFGDMGTARAGFDLEPAGSGTEVTWTFESDLGMNPVLRYFGLMFDRWVGADYETGLASLKTLVEQQGANDG